MIAYMDLPPFENSIMEMVYTYGNYSIYETKKKNFLQKNASNVFSLFVLVSDNYYIVK